MRRPTIKNPVTEKDNVNSTKPVVKNPYSLDKWQTDANNYINDLNTAAKNRNGNYVSSGDFQSYLDADNQRASRLRASAYGFMDDMKQNQNRYEPKIYDQAINLLKDFTRSSTEASNSLKKEGEYWDQFKSEKEYDFYTNGGRSSAEIQKEIDALQGKADSVANAMQERNRGLVFEDQKDADAYNSDYLKQLEEIGRQRESLDREYAAAKQFEYDDMIANGYRDATLRDLTIGGLKQGYNETARLSAAEEDRTLGSNNAQKYVDRLESDEYKFVPKNKLQERVLGMTNQAGQKVEHLANKKSAILGIGLGIAGGIASGIPGAVAGFNIGRRIGMITETYKAEAQGAYEEMIEEGITPETAEGIAGAVGAINAKLEDWEMDNLVNAIKGGVESKFKSNAIKYVTDQALSAAEETMQEMAQETVTLAGTQIGSLMDKGEYAYDFNEAFNRVRDTGIDSFITFAAMGVGGSVAGKVGGFASNKVSDILRDKRNAGEPVADSQIALAEIAEGRKATEQDAMTIMTENGVDERLAKAVAPQVAEEIQRTVDEVKNKAFANQSEGMNDTESATMRTEENVLSKGESEPNVTDRRSFDAITEIGRNGKKAMQSSYDETSDTADYARDFVRAYNETREGKELSKSDVMSDTQIRIASDAAKLDMDFESKVESVVGDDPALNGFMRSQELDAVKATSKTLDADIAKAFTQYKENNNETTVRTEERFNNLDGREGAEGNSEKRGRGLRTGRRELELSQISDYVKSHQGEIKLTSTAKLGWGSSSSSNETFALLPQEGWTTEIHNLVNRYKAKGRTVIPIIGSMEAFSKNSKKMTMVRAAVDVNSDRIWVQVDNPNFTPEQLIIHEDGHLRIKDAGFRADLISKIRENGSKKLDAMIEAYKVALKYQIPEKSDPDYEQKMRALAESATDEILCDAFAGMNIFAPVSDVKKGAEQFTDIVNSVEEKSPETNKAPPDEVKFSEEVYKSTDGKLSDDFISDIPFIGEFSNVKFSNATYEEETYKRVNKISGTGDVRVVDTINSTGRGVLEDAIDKYNDKATASEKKKTILSQLDSMSKLMKDMRLKYTKIGLNDLDDAKVVLKQEMGEDGQIHQRVILSAMVKNGVYPVNFDLTKVCSRREGMTNFIKELSRRPGINGGDTMLDEISLSVGNLNKLNKLLRKYNFDTACLGCFVEARRFNIEKWAQKFVSLYNAEVKKQNPKADYFGFAKQEVNEIKDISRKQLEKLKDETEQYLLDKQNANKEKRSTTGGNLNTEEKIREFVKGQNAQHLLRIGDLITEDGRTNLHQFSEELESLILANYGSNTPKSMEVFTPYNSEIELLDNNVSGYDDLATYIKHIAGVRSQSFSDFIITHFFDVAQKTAAMASRDLVAHCYTKVPARILLFGMTGEKQNMSIMFNIEPTKGSVKNSEWWRAGLDKDGNYLVGDEAGAAKYKELYGEEAFVQSFPFDLAVRIENTEGYAGNNGTIGVGYSYDHMVKMFLDNDIRFIIGYHSSGLPAAIKKVTYINQAADYQSTQGTNRIVGFREVTNAGSVPIPSYATWAAKTKESKITSKDALLSKEQRAKALIMAKQEHDQSVLANEKDSKVEIVKETTAHNRIMKQMYEDAIKEKYAEKIAQGFSVSEAGNEVMKDILKFCKENNLTIVTEQDEHYHGSFDLYEDLDSTKEPRETTGNFISWCMRERGVLPINYEFTHIFDESGNLVKNDGYYKLIYDFDVYNPITGEYAPQNPVQMKFPENFNEMVDGFMDEYQGKRIRESENMNPLIEEAYGIMRRGSKEKMKTGNISESARMMKTYEMENRFIDSLNKENDSDVRFSEENTYNPIREKLAKQKLDQLSELLGDRFPLSANFDKTMSEDESPINTSVVAKEGSETDDSKSYFSKAKKIFDKYYKNGLKVRHDDLNDDIWLGKNVMSETVSKLVGTDNESDLQSYMDIIPHLKELLESSKVLGVERLLHSGNKNAGLLAYKMYSYFTYELESGEKIPCILGFSAVQSLDEIGAYIIKEIKNVTIHQALTPNSAYTQTMNDDTISIAQLYNTVKQINHIDGGLRYSDEEAGKYQFKYTERADGVRFSEENATFKEDIKKVATGSVFSGFGGVEIALRKVTNSEFGVEYDNKVAAVFKTNHGDVINDDIRNVDFNKLVGRVDYFHASPVCKNYSNLNRERGTKADNNIDMTTAQSTAEAITTLMPKVFTLEQVPGYVGSDAMQVILDTLEETGYDYDYHVFNSYDYGAAISRERVLLRAVRNGKLPALPEKVKGASWYGAAYDMIDSLPDYKFTPNMQKKINGTDIDYSKSPILVLYGVNSSKVNFSYADEPCKSIKTDMSEAGIIMPDGSVKRATPELFARLMGFPDSTYLGKTQELKYKVVGNSVPANLTQKIFGNLLDEALHTGVKFSEEISTEIAEKNKELRQTVAELNKATRRAEKAEAQLKRTETPTVKESDIAKLSKQLIDQVDSEIDRNELKDSLRSIANYILSDGNGNGIIYEDLKEMCVDTARRMVEDAKVITNADAVAEVKKFRQYLKGQKFYLANRGNISEFTEFKKKNASRFKITANPADVTIDSRWAEMHEMFPDLIPEAEGFSDPTEMAEYISDLLDNIVPSKENLYQDYELAEVTEHFANSILESMLSEKVRQNDPTYADRMERKVTNEKIKAGNREEELKTAYEEKLKNVRDRKVESIEAIKEHYRQVNADRIARKKDSAARTKLFKIAKRLNNKKLDAVTRAKLQEYIGDLDLVAKSMTGNSVRKLIELGQWYDDAIADGKMERDARIEEKLKRLSRKQISSLTQSEVADLTEVLQGIEHGLQEKNKLLKSEAAKSLAESRDKTISDVKQTKGLKGLKYKVDSLFVSGTLSPERMMHRIVGYNDKSPLYVLTKELSAGQRNMLDFQRRAQESFRKFTSDKKFMQSIRGDKAELIEITGIGSDGKEQKAIITPSMRMSLYLHSKNLQNMAHITGGGITVPDLDLYLAGDMEEAYARGKHLALSSERVHDIISTMSDKERAFADAASKYFNEMSQSAINETSEALNGYSLANVEEYFPINTDSSFLNADYETVKHDGSIEGMGFLKERTKASNPIMLRDMDAVLAQSIRMTSKYVGLAIPVRNFQNVWNSQELRKVDEYGNTLKTQESVKSVIKEKWGATATNYIDNLMRDVQGGAGRKSDAQDKLLQKIRSNYAGAVLTMNISVAMKQAASYPTAGYILGAKNLTKALADFKKVDENLIAKYTPLLWYRSLGWDQVDLGDLKFDGKHTPKALNWIQGMDIATTKKLWRASEFKVREDNQNLELGSDAYYKAVAEVYNRVIEETQPNYTVMQRPDLLRTDNTLKAALMMFKTQPFQNFNIMYDAIGNARAKYNAMLNGSITEDEYKSATKEATRAVVSQVAQLAVFSGMTMAVKLLMGKGKPYKNDEDEFDPWLTLIKDMGGSAAGALPFGGEIWSALNSIVTGEKYYGFDDVTASAISGLLEASIGLANGISSVVGSVQNGDKLDSQDLYLTFKQSVKSFAEFAGVPASNMENLLNRMVYAGAYLATQNKYLAELTVMEMTVSRDKKSSQYYDLLFKAYDKDPAAYNELYSKFKTYMGADDSTIITKMENKAKKKYGVTKTEDLPYRYLTPEKQSEYDKGVGKIKSTTAYSKANKEQRAYAEELMRSAVLNQKSFQDDYDKYNFLSEEEYIAYKLALKVYDKPSESGKLGTYTKEEKENAINSLSLSKSAYEKLYEAALGKK